MSADPRIVELEALARASGLVLPMPAAMIVRLEDSGRIVDLVDGTIYNSIVVVPERSAQAICHLLGSTNS